MLSAEASSAICVQRLDDSRKSAIHITYRISLRSSSLREPRYPLLRVVCWLCAAAAGRSAGFRRGVSGCCCLVQRSPRDGGHSARPRRTGAVSRQLHRSRGKARPARWGQQCRGTRQRCVGGLCDEIRRSLRSFTYGDPAVGGWAPPVRPSTSNRILTMSGPGKFSRLSRIKHQAQPVRLVIPFPQFLQVRRSGLSSRIFLNRLLYAVGRSGPSGRHRTPDPWGPRVGVFYHVWAVRRSNLGRYCRILCSRTFRFQIPADGRPGGFSSRLSIGLLLPAYTVGRFGPSGRPRSSALNVPNFRGFFRAWAVPDAISAVSMGPCCTLVRAAWRARTRHVPGLYHVCDLPVLGTGRY